jgi:hypothetical protein
MLLPIFLLIVGASAFSPPSPSHLNITLQVFEGTLQGFFESPAFPHLESCASDVHEAYAELKAAIGEIEQKTPAGVKAGIKDLATAYTSLKAALVDCKAAEVSVAKLALALETGFEHPASFVFHVGERLVINGQDILAEVTAAVADWKAGSYHAAGQQLGRALSKLLVQDFDAWRQRHAKVYSSAEQQARAREAYQLNVDLVRSSHLQRAAGVSYHLNEYADLAPREFNLRNGFVPSAMPRATRTHTPSAAPAPSAVDWRDQGLVADVKNQGTCGSCWAFSTVVSIEGQHAKQAGKLSPLSEQNLVDCVTGVQLPDDDASCCMGCKGGLMDDAFDYLMLKQHGAIDTEAAYPYTGRAGTCSYEPSEAGAAIGSWTNIPEGDEAALLDAVATVGPVSVAVDASIGWQLYLGGIMRPLLCSSNPKKMDHGVAVVGYGTEGGTDYWIVRNSWGARWGEKGYARVLRGKNACGIANSASYPTSVTHVEVPPDEIVISPAEVEAPPGNSKLLLG